MINISLTANSLLILFWNANGIRIRNHLADLIFTIHNKRIDIALSYLTSHSKIHMPCYNVLLTNHPDDTTHGGAVILIKSSLLYHPFSQFTESYIQAYTILIKLDHTLITITSAYYPPKHNITPIQY